MTDDVITFAHPKPPLDIRRPAHRPRKFTEDVALEICDRLGDGEKLHDICKREGMPSACTVRRWARDDKEFRGWFEAALEARFMLDVEEILAIADDSSDDYELTDGEVPTVRPNKEAVARSLLKIETRFKAAAKQFPGRLADPHPTAGGNDKPTQEASAPAPTLERRETLISLIDAASARAVATR
jgi:hypothetical protein